MSTPVGIPVRMSLRPRWNLRPHTRWVLLQFAPGCPIGARCNSCSDGLLERVTIPARMRRRYLFQFPPACGIGAHWNLHPDVPLPPVGIYTHGAVPRNRDAVIVSQNHEARTMARESAESVSS